MDSATEPLLVPQKDRVYDSIYPHPEVTINADGVPDVVVINKADDNAKDRQTKIYKRRWYILFVFSLIAFAQGAIWNTWGPIAATSEEAFNWTDADIALFANWGPIAYLIATFPFAWLIDVKGLRPASIIAAFMVAAGAGIRCITDDLKYVKWTVNIGQLLNGLAGPVAMGGPPAVSAMWFPANERTTATALNCVINVMGVAVSFIIGPYFVPEIPGNNTVTMYNISIGGNYSTLFDENQHNETKILRERKDIMKLMYWGGIASVDRKKI